jgi:hypothetical protein
MPCASAARGSDFQALEFSVLIFPRPGKNRLKFSSFRFQSLEKMITAKTQKPQSGTHMKSFGTCLPARPAIEFP